MSVTQRLGKSRLLGLPRDWLFLCIYPDSNDRRENLWGIHEIGITGQDLKKRSFLILGKRELFASKSQMWVTRAFPKGSQFPLSPL